MLRKFMSILLVLSSLTLVAQGASAQSAEEVQKQVQDVGGG